jgi:hypothetical protein
MRNSDIVPQVGGQRDGTEIFPQVGGQIELHIIFLMYGNGMVL